MIGSIKWLMRSVSCVVNHVRRLCILNTQYCRTLYTHPRGLPVKQSAHVLTLQETWQHRCDHGTLQWLLITCGIKSKVSSTISKVPHDLILTHPFCSAILFHSFSCSPCASHTDLFLFSQN